MIFLTTCSTWWSQLHTHEQLYQPNKISAPGETLLVLLEEREMSQAELAKRTGRPLKTIRVR